MCTVGMDGAWRLQEREEHRSDVMGISIHVLS